MRHAAINRFARDEGGAVTVDWVVLTAALVGLSLAVVGTLWSGFETQSTGIQTMMNENTIDTEF